MMLHGREAEAQEPEDRTAPPPARGPRRERHLSVVPHVGTGSPPRGSGSKVGRAIRAVAAWTAVGPPS